LDSQTVNAQEAIGAIAVQCRPGEAPVTLTSATDGRSCCVASEQAARDTAAGRDPDILAVAVITADGIVTAYEVTRHAPTGGAQ
jgi:hypothetical protein